VRALGWVKYYYYLLEGCLCAARRRCCCYVDNAKLLRVVCVKEKIAGYTASRNQPIAVSQFFYGFYVRILGSIKILEYLHVIAWGFHFFYHF
jgi:hypothetical protein